MSSIDITASTESFLAEPRNMILSTIRRDGRPQLTPVWFIWRDGELLISTTPATAKWKNLLRDPRCTGLVDYPGGKYISVTGIAEMSKENIPHEITSEIVRKYVEPERYQSYMEMIRSDRPERGIIHLRPERIITSGFD